MAEANGMRAMTKAEVEDAAEVMYDPKPASVALWIWSGEEAGSVCLGVEAPAELVDEALSQAQAALARVPAAQRSPQLGGLDPADAAAFTPEEAFIRRFVQTSLLTRGQMRAGLAPFDDAELPTQDLPTPGEPYFFVASFYVQPTYELDSYEPLRLSLPAPVEPSEAEIDETLASLAAQTGAAQVDDAWVAAYMPEQGDLCSLRAAVREKFRRDADGQRLQLARSLCAQQLAVHLVGDPGERLVQLRAERAMQDELAACQAQGVTLKQYLSVAGIDEEAWRRRHFLAAHDELKGEFALEALARELGLLVDEGDIARAVRTCSSQALRWRLEWWLESGQTHRLCAYALRMRAADWLVEHAAS